MYIIYLYILLFLGLLVEPNTQSYKKLLGKNRNVASINVCISRTDLPELVDFVNAGTISGIQGKWLTYTYIHNIHVSGEFFGHFGILKLICIFVFTDIEVDDWFQVERFYTVIRGAKHNSKALCLPFFTILNALGNPTVDYFSLDVEGSEFPILFSIPWKKVTIGVMRF